MKFVTTEVNHSHLGITYFDPFWILVEIDVSGYA